MLDYNKLENLVNQAMIEGNEEEIKSLKTFCEKLGIRGIELKQGELEKVNELLEQPCLSEEMNHFLHDWEQLKTGLELLCGRGELRRAQEVCEWVIHNDAKLKDKFIRMKGGLDRLHKPK